MSGSDQLAGNGISLIRERAVAGRVQFALERMYRLERTADIGDFVREADPGERETLLLREVSVGDVEMSVFLPHLGTQRKLDTVCQIIEGVSHFVYLVDRVQTGRKTTQLELELQAEVDKWVVLAAATESFDADRSQQLRECLYEEVAFAHDPSSDLGQRYRTANTAANRFVRRLEHDYVKAGRFSSLHEQLRRFFLLNQEGKLRLGSGA